MHIFAKTLVAASVSVIFAGNVSATPPIVTAATAISGQGGSAYSEGAAAYGGDNVARGGASSAFSGGGSNSTQVDNGSGDTKTLGVAWVSHRLPLKAV